MTTLPPITGSSSTHGAPDALGWTRCHDPETVVWHPDNCVHATIDAVHATTGTYADYVAERHAWEQAMDQLHLADA